MTDPEATATTAGPGTRLAAARRALADAGVDALLVGPGADLRYLLGYDAPALERLTLLVLPAHGEPALVVPELEAPRARAAGAARHVGLHAWAETDDPVEAVARLAEDRGVAGGRIALQDRLWTVFTLRLQQRLDRASWVPGTAVMRPLRIVKQPAELDRLRAAAAAIDAVHAQIPALLEPGRTEAAVGRDIAELILDGHDSVAFVIVAAGPDGASPHHDTGPRPLAAGEPVVVDIGGVRDGYCSDATRNYVLGRPPDDYRAMYEVLQQAQHAAVSAVEPGVRAEEVDAAARRVLADAGYADRFIHRTGHGIGIEPHEPPWIVGGATEELRPGMVFSVEPGVYVPGRHGARIEDIVAVTADGAERLNARPRDLVVVDT